ncbi:DUF5134 domain-containing protein [Nocardia sp. NPDC024068]|uniref:DUF5134 domain-containing protein n=1 Tax=Nocardia sp. NPDC024068 TaxID=3157197 RepID=UPI0033F8641F
MAEFDSDQAAVRALVAVAFAVAALVVLARVGVPRRALASGRGGGAACADGSADHESDAAHLLMCAVMVVMLLFPARLNAHAVQGVLLAMILVFAALLLDRVARWRRMRESGHRVAALGYHLVAAAVMLWAMSGHAGAGHGAVPAAGPLMIFAAVFLIDAVVLVATVRGSRGWPAHPAAHGGLPVAVLPHLVMDLGMAYMVFAAATG